MGSSGSGRFSDYSGSKNIGATGEGIGGGTSGIDRCRQAFSVGLEEVAQCEYFERNKGVPPAGTTINIIFDRRIFAVDEGGTKVGALPTSFNYLAACMADGHRYVGVVRVSTGAPTPRVEADFAAQ